jgi:hypothetical protein
MLVITMSASISKLGQGSFVKLSAGFLSLVVAQITKQMSRLNHVNIVEPGLKQAHLQTPKMSKSTTKLFRTSFLSYSNVNL